tara:strand:- start:742 stop:1269 length:528 start_codon:yes stop_codon:yes gene_type:complete
MNVENTYIQGVKIITPNIFLDDRGYFFESYNENSFNENYKKITFVQDNESKSKFGTLRGIHFQKSPYEQSKLVRVIKGKVQDVVVDLRPDSITFKKYISIILDDISKKQLFIPKGFGHGFLVLSNQAIVSYKVDAYYSQNHDRGIKFDDPTLNINWLLEKKDIILSDKDSQLPYL